MRKMKTRNSCYTYFKIVGEFDPQDISNILGLNAEESTPCLAPTLDVIDFCHSTRTELDIDLYIIDLSDELCEDN